jgi:hypothetical protein
VAQEFSIRSKALGIAIAGLKVFRSFSIIYFLAFLLLHWAKPHQFSPLDIKEIMRSLLISLLGGALTGLASCFFQVLREMLPPTRKPEN